MTEATSLVSSPRSADRGERSRRTSLRVSPVAIALALPLLLVVVAVVAVLVPVVVHSFEESTGLLTSTWSLENYSQLFAAKMLPAFGYSFGLGVGSAALATVIGVVLAWTLTRVAMPARRLFEILAYVPFFLSTVILSIAWVYLASPQTGFLTKLVAQWGITLPDIYSPVGIAWVLTIANVPLVVMMCSASFRQMDSSLEHASRTSGAGPVRTAVRVTLPLASPAIISSFILSFVFSVEDFGAAYVLGHPHGIDTLSVWIFDSIQSSFPPNYNFAAAVGVVMMVITMACVFAQQRYLRRRSFVTITGKATSQELRRAGGARWIALAVNVVYSLFTVVLPLFALVAAALSNSWTGVLHPSAFTFAHFKELTGPGAGSVKALENSLLLSVGTATVVVVLAILVVYALQRQRIPGSGILASIVSLPVAVPGTVIAVGVLNLLIGTPFYGTLLIIAFAYAVRFFPYGQNAVGASLSAVHPELEEASYTSGVGRIGTLRRVVVPLLRPGIVSAWLLLFMIYMREVSMSAMLWSTDTKTLSVELINSIFYQPAGTAAAFAAVQVLIILVPAVVVVRISGAEALGGIK